MKVLVVGDKEYERRPVAEAVEKLGHSVVEAADGTFAWQALLNDHFDVVISDYLMPEMNGLELCRKVRERPDPSYTYFMIVSTRTESDNVLAGFKSGVDDYLAKPVSPVELHCRLILAERVIQMHRELSETNAQLVELSNQLKLESRSDALTGVGNRLKFRDDVKRFVDERRRYQRNFYLALCDIDNFKLYNDTYGHLEGDKVLKAVASTLSTRSRSSDCCYRYGGEEFLLVFAEQEAGGAETVAERLRIAVEELDVEHVKNQPYGRVTLSMGLSRFLANDPHDVDGCLKRADDALYRSKRDGRNRITLAYRDPSQATITLSNSSS